MNVVDAPVVVVGAGPAGLATAACLHQRGVRPIVLERADRVGSAWETHYHRLHLHTPRQTSALPHHPWPPGTPTYPSRQQVVEYLRSYAAAHGIEPRFGQHVRSVTREGGAWHVRAARAGGADETDYVTPAVVLSTGYNNRPNRPDVPGLDAFAGTVVHSKQYGTGADYAGQRALVVGCGNSGAEIAIDLHEQGAKSAIVVRGPVHVVPRDMFGFVPSARTAIAMRHFSAPVADMFTVPLLRVLVGDLSAYGIVRPHEGPRTLLERTGRVPILDIGLVALIRSGDVRVFPGVTSVSGHDVTFADGRTEPFDVIVLATGFTPDVSELVRADVFDDHGVPRAHGDATEPGLHFVGFKNPITGQLREIGLQARRAADAIVGSL